MPHRVAHATDLAVTALVDGEANGVGVGERCPSRRGQAVLQLDSLPEAADGTGRRRPFDRGQVLLLHAVRRVGEAVGQVTVVGEKKQSLGVGVEAADREDAGLVGHEVEDGWTALRIAGRRDNAARLVEEVVDEVSGGRDGDAVDLDPLASRIHPTAQRRHFAVDRDAAVLDEDLARPPAAEAGASEKLLEPLGL